MRFKLLFNVTKLVFFHKYLFEKKKDFFFFLNNQKMVVHNLRGVFSIEKEKAIEMYRERDEREWKNSNPMT